MKKPVVFLVCTGLGRINRGYESFTQECFDTLKNSAEFDLYLIKGAGEKNKKEKPVFNFHRNGKTAKLFQRLFNIRTYATEQISFCIFLLPFIIRQKPSLIYYSEFALGSYLWHLRKHLKFKYRLLFCNGAPNGPPYKTEDHVQQLLPVYYSIGIKADKNGSKHTLLPYAFNINVEKNKMLIDNKEAIRQQLGFTPAQKLVLSVGALNKKHKRVDYIIKETAALPGDYFLIMLGQFDDETKEIKNLAGELLAGRHYIANLKQNELANYYAAADVFVLASLNEGFPRVTIEALSYGLPCIVRDYIVNRQILKDNGTYIDMRFEGELSKALEKIQEGNKSIAMQFAFEAYSWNNLAQEYSNMIMQQLCYTA